MDQSDRSGSVGGSSECSSSRRPQDFYYDIKFSPQPARRIPSSAQNKVVRNRLRAFEIASRVLRDAASCVDDNEDQRIMIESDFQYLTVGDDHHNQGSSDKAASDHIRGTKSYSTESLDFGNNSDSRVHKMRRDTLRREPVSGVGGPAREWGDLTYHNSSSQFTPAPKSPPRYPPPLKY